MQTRPTRTGLLLTEIGFGGAPLGNLYNEISDDEAGRTVDTAWQSGIRYFDTAPHYGLGLSEKRLGATLQKYPRDQYVLSTKVGRLLVPNRPGSTAAEPLTRVWDFSRSGVLRSLEASLNRLGLDRIDIVYVHDADEHFDEAASATIPALIELRDQGVISALGVGMNQTELPARFIRETDIDLVMLAGRYTLLEQTALNELLPLAEQHGVGIVAAGVFNSGLLSTNRPTANAKYDYNDAPPAVIARANELADLCEAHGVSLPEAAIAFPLQHPAVVSVVVGAQTAAEVTSNALRYNSLAGNAPQLNELWRDLSARGLVAATNR